MLIKTLHKISMPAGVRLRLTEEQFDRRQYVVGRDTDGVSLVTTPLQFKAGETVEIEGEMPRSIPAEFYQVEDVVIETEFKEGQGTGEVMTAVKVPIGVEAELPPAPAKPKAKKAAKTVKVAAVDDVK